MKNILIQVIIVGCAASVLSCSGSGKTAIKLGVTDGKLAPCPDSPNCVSSQAGDAVHKIEPLAYKTDRTDAFSRLVTVIKGMKRTRIISSTDNYIHAEFTSKIFRFVDDVEFYFTNAGKVIHVRSASRVGYGDMGVNRKRVEEIRMLFTEKEK